MQHKVLAAMALLSVGVTLSACSQDTAQESAPASTPAATSAVSTASVTAQSGTFGGLNDKKVSGTVRVSGQTVTLSGYSSDPGPDLHIYLTNGTDEAAVAAGVRLGSVASDQADQTFQVSGDGAYTNVVIHCDKAKAVFGAATLS